MKPRKSTGTRKREGRSEIVLKPSTLAVGDRVEVSISVADKEGAVKRPAFGEIVALDQVAVRIEGEVDARAFPPKKVRVL